MARPHRAEAVTRSDDLGVVPQVLGFKQMFTKIRSAACLFALLAGPSGLACQPQGIDRTVRGNIDVGRRDGSAGAGGGSGGSAGLGDASTEDPATPDMAPVIPPPTGTGGAPAVDASVVPPPRPDAGADGGGGQGTPDAVANHNDAAPADARPDLASGDGRVDAPPDTAPVSATDKLINDLLALTPATCAMKAAGDFDFDQPGSAGAGKAAICGIKGAFYWVADLNIDCDGRNPAGSKCTGEHGTDTFTRNKDNQALSPTATPFVVVPTSAANPDLPAVALKPGAIVAVINHQTRKIVFAVFGDTETDNRIGAASYACAEQLGIDPNPVTGGQKGGTVTYVAFTDATAVPKDVESQTEARTLGQTLAAKLLVDNK
jgi:hypothetical protein